VHTEVGHPQNYYHLECSSAVKIQQCSGTHFKYKLLSLYYNCQDAQTTWIVGLVITEEKLMVLKQKMLDTFREDINFCTFLAFMNLFREESKLKQSTEWMYTSNINKATDVI
jgi:hypothetical protein